MTHPRTRSWEVYRNDPVDFVGILVLSEIDPGHSARAHFRFFDGTLKDKHEILESWFDWAFKEFNLEQVSTEVPTYAFKAKSFCKKVGFCDKSILIMRMARDGREHGTDGEA